MQRVDDEADGGHVVREELAKVLPLDVEEEQRGHGLEVVAFRSFFLSKFFFFFYSRRVLSFSFPPFCFFFGKKKKNSPRLLSLWQTEKTHPAPARTPAPWAA